VDLVVTEAPKKESAKLRPLSLNVKITQKKIPGKNIKGKTRLENFNVQVH
jgi:hypothetical protein